MTQVLTLPNLKPIVSPKRTLRTACRLLMLSLLTACQLPLQTQIAPAGRHYYIPPEYEPSQGVIVSEHLTTFPNGNELLSALLAEKAEIWMLSSGGAQLSRTRSELSQRFGLQAEQLENLKAVPVTTDSVWARDWAPLISYSTTSPGQFGLVDFRYYPDRVQDDAVPTGVTSWLRSQAKGQSFQTLPVGVELEGGNVLCTRQNCFVTAELIQRVETNHGYTPEQGPMVAELEKYLDQEFWVVPRMPFESTGHIDIWAKLLDTNTLVIGQISPESLASVPPQLQVTYTQVMNFLEEQATGVDAAGNESPSSLAAVIKRLHPEIRIERIPMPTPGIYQGVETFRTYTNSLLFNQTAIVPRYVRGQRFNPAERDLAQEQERRVEEVYKAAGYSVVWIRADNLIRDGGAWHCVAMQVPKLDTVPAG